MIVLGISALDKESTASLVCDGKLVAAVSEERFSRVKQQKGFPYRSVEWLCRDAGINTSDIDAVAYPFFAAAQEETMRNRSLRRHIVLNWREKQPWGYKLSHTLRAARMMWRERNTFLREFDTDLMKGLQALNLTNKLHRYDHQDCHAAAAIYTSGFERALAVTIDNYGSGAAAAIYRFEHGDLTELLRVPYPNSMGIFYALVTKNLGFRPDRHEGKILGLAAYGDSSVLYNEVRNRFSLNGQGLFYKSVFHQAPDSRWAKNYPREHVAAAYQCVLEDVVVTLVRRYVKETGIDCIALAGGVFANVKLNQRLAELPEVRQVFVHPAMSDMGTGTGAAFLHAAKHGEVVPYRLEHAYWGPGFSDDDIKKALSQSQAEGEFHADIADRAAQLLAQGRVVGYFEGRMEYGPRALGHRSILCQATESQINQTLNARLKRTEFMPFAPATLIEDASRCYIGVEKAAHSAEFMTITFDCTPEMRRLSPAAVHVDGTARPQLVRRDVSPAYYDIIAAYRRLTGIPSIINTSFNIHEEPIVCTPQDAIGTFRDGRLDYLVLGNWLVRCS